MMQTLIYEIQLDTPQGAATLSQAGAYIRQGELVAFPTETVYGLGANALDEKAVAKIFFAKGRPADNPLIAHIASIDMGEKLADFTPLARALAMHYWPGPLTMVLPRKPIVPDIVTAGLDTVALRWPSHPIAAALIREAATPIAAPSANLSGRPSPTRATHVWEDLGGKISLILDGGPVHIGLESTVVDARGRYPILLRPGKITAEELSELCGDCLFPQAGDEKRPAAPGMKYRHYAPRGQVYLAKNVQEALMIAGRLAGSPLFLVSRETARELEKAGINAKRIRPLYAQGDLDCYAQNLFSSLRDADSTGEVHIVVEEVAEVGIGRAIMNRLKKAAAG
jgi:L-threonylcarbamoyladenylate synthase